MNTSRVRGLLSILSCFVVLGVQSCGSVEETPINDPGDKTGLINSPQATETTVEFIIRPGPDGNWVILSDASHQPKNIASLVTYQTYIQAQYLGVLTFVHTFMCVPDEKLTKAGYSVGASGGRDVLNIFLHKDGSNFYTNPHTLDSHDFPFGNINCFVSGGL